MRTYLATTGGVFLLLTVAHIWRAVVERHLVRDPWFLLTTLISMALAVWAVSLLRRTPR